MDSLQTITIKNIIENISDNEQLLSIKQCIEVKYKENINQEYKSHYWSKEDGKFDNKLSQTIFSNCYGGGFDADENEVRYRFCSNKEGFPLIIRDIETIKVWKFLGTWDNFTIYGYKDVIGYNLINDPPKEILDYAIFLWKYKN